MDIGRTLRALWRPQGQSLNWTHEGSLFNRGTAAPGDTLPPQTGLSGKEGRSRVQGGWEDRPKAREEGRGGGSEAPVTPTRLSASLGVRRSRGSAGWGQSLGWGALSPGKALARGHLRPPTLVKFHLKGRPIIPTGVAWI